MTTFNYRIHPAIGIARVGNSDEYYLGPETVAGLKEDAKSTKTGGLPIKPGTESDTITSSDIRDGHGAFKKQAARFKIYQYALDSDTETYPMNLPENQIQEIKIGSKVGTKTVTNIIWTVHVANKKANTFVLVEYPNMPEGIKGYENGLLPPIRNADINNPSDSVTQPKNPVTVLNEPGRVKKLTIDAGPRVISGCTSPAVTFDKKTMAQYCDNGGNTHSLPDYPKSFPQDSFSDLDCPTEILSTLGELRTDEHGRLIVTGGNGTACSWGEHKLDADVNNNQWFDDTSDGPVNAVLKFDDGSYQPVDAGAWVTTTDPSYAPQTLNIVPLFDDIYNSWVRNLNLSPDLYSDGVYQTTFEPCFDDHLNPIFQSVALQRWNINLPKNAISSHDNVGKIKATDTPSETILASVETYIRNPNKNDFGTIGTLMPLALGGANKSLLSVTKTQYFYLTQWHKGNFKPGQRSVLGPGELLDKNVLMNCLGGRFSPGIDLTFIVRQADMYISDWATSGKGPFRVRPSTLDYSNCIDNTKPLLTAGYIPCHTDNGLEPGDLSKFMAIPWHTDYNSCATHLPSPNPDGNKTLFWSWPAQRPVAVYVAKDVAANGDKLINAADSSQLQRWSVRGEYTSSDSTPAENWGRYQKYSHMLTHWQNIGVVMQGTSIDKEDGGPFDSSYYLEVASLLKEGKTPTNAVEPYPNIEGHLPMKK